MAQRAAFLGFSAMLWIGFASSTYRRGQLLLKNSACSVDSSCKRSNLPRTSLFSVDHLQVEAERTEVLRLAAELNNLRAASEQDAVAAGEREAALKALLASETEVRS